MRNGDINRDTIVVKSKATKEFIKNGREKLKNKKENPTRNSSGWIKKEKILKKKEKYIDREKEIDTKMTTYKRSRKENTFVHTH